MKPFNDSIPEEIETQHNALISMLRHALPHSVQLAPDEQAQIIERASRRLPVNDQAVSGEGDEAAQPAGVANSIPVKKLASSPFVARRGRRIVQFASMLAAVLVVAAIVSASLLLFQHRQAQTIGSVPRPFHPPANMTTASSTAGGFEMSLSLTPGPYFLSELLAANISLTNYTGKTMYVGIPFVGSSCGYVTGVLMTGGSSPQYNIPIDTDHSCPAIDNSTLLKAGQTLTVQKYLPLTNIGHVTLTAETELYTSARQPQTPFPQPVFNPLDGHWPSLQIAVASKVPANRIIAYHRDGSSITINVPASLQRSLVYLYGVRCGNGFTGNFGWYSITSTKVNAPRCQFAGELHWTFAFGVPGYAIVQGQYP